ncbi:MAG: UDP-N-acetylmuramoyl-L-alanine--D-glutamate ligase [Anaerovoracaceae bacterium]|jgi:UDP-N-acetylmuramoylalanine--D-glutamate ligase
MRDENRELRDKRVLVVGLGRSGEAAVRAVFSLEAEVTAYDGNAKYRLSDEFGGFLRENDIECQLGGTPDVTGMDMLVLSPGVPTDLPFIQEARESGIEVIGELEAAYRYGHGKYIAITGTNGKTTTTTLVGEIFRNAGRKTEVVGNIGVPVITKAMEADDDTWLVAEVSSFQLETVDTFRPEVSAILNLTPDHMDRHKTMENYGRAKARVFMNQGKDEYLVINFDDKVCFSLAKNSDATIVPFSRKDPMLFGAYVHNDMISVRGGEGDIHDLCGVDELIIPGTHNLENALAAAAISYFAGVEPDVIAETLRTFRGVEHRIEPCGEINGVKFVNDSKGTNPDAAIKAIEAIKGDIVIIAGGYDKGSQYEEFVGAFDDKVKHAVLLGATAAKIKDTCEHAGFTNTIILKDMKDCVSEAYRLAKKGDTVLLSPACASWDMYPNFEERGRDFKQCVEALKNDEEGAE